MNEREKIFEGFRDHAWLRRVYAKLTKAERDIAIAFLRDHADASVEEFEHKAHRLFLHLDTGQKPKHFTAIIELLVCANSEYRARTKQNP